MLKNIAKLNEDSELAYEKAKAEAKEKADVLVKAAEKLCLEAEERAQKAQKRLEEIEERIREIHNQKKLLDEMFKDPSAKLEVDINEE